MLSAINEFYFGSLGKEYCHLFWAFSVIAFLSAVILIVSVFANAIMSKSKFDAKTFLLTIPMVIAYILIYFQNRILHSMCMKTLT